MADMETSERPAIYIHTDHNADAVRCFYEIPDELAKRIQPEGDARTFTQCVADIVLPER